MISSRIDIEPEGIRAFVLAALVYLALLVILWDKWAFAEDALINFVYAEHVGQGFGVRYNVFKPPVEGTTPLGWVLLISLGEVIGVGVGPFARALSALFGLGIIGVVTWFSLEDLADTRLVYVPPLVAAVTYLPLHSLSGFGTVGFGGAYLLTAWAGYRLLDRDEWQYRALFGVSGLLLSVIRPEGALLFGATWLAYAYVTGVDRGSVLAGINRETVTAAAPVVVAVAAYHLGRISYFGYLFPNPFYVKGTGNWNVWHGLNSLRFTLDAFQTLNILLVAFLVVGVVHAVYRYDSYRNRLLLLAAPAVTHFSIYLFIVQTQNTFKRFQYVGILFAVAMLPLALRGLRSRWPSSEASNHQLLRVVTVVLILGLVVQPLAFTLIKDPGYVMSPQDDRKLVGKALSEYEENNYTIWTHEAGGIVYYSKWNALDLSRLNSEALAHGAELESYMESQPEPDVLLFTVFGPPMPPECSPTSWSEENTIFYEYAKEHGFRLAAAIPKPGGDVYQWYWVNPDTEKAEELVETIRGVDRPWVNASRSC
ncbi:MAG: hypothetical protein ABEH77_10985 [Halobacteriaceae archaeon]